MVGCHYRNSFADQECSIMPSEKITLRVADFDHVSDFVIDHTKTCVVGRAGDCDIRIPDDYWHGDVSRHHCAIEVDPPSVRVRDLGSTNGTLVNGTFVGSKYAMASRRRRDDVTAQELSDGDEIQVGSVVLKVTVGNDDESWIE